MSKKEEIMKQMTVTTVKMVHGEVMRITFTAETSCIIHSAKHSAIDYEKLAKETLYHELKDMFRDEQYYDDVEIQQ